jgi:sigma-E factor negative regulatory protein RseA
MSEKLRESLSALMDDETNELELQRLLKQMGDDTELRQTWVRYQAARTALHGHEMTHLQLDISARVREAVAAENSSHPLRDLKDRLVRPLASFAVAASVAATVVIGGQQLAQVSGADPYGTDGAVTAGVSPVGLVNSLGATTVQASYGTQAVPVLQPATGTAYKELARQRMQLYMQEHAEHAALNSPHGLIPFARVPEIRE